MTRALLIIVLCGVLGRVLVAGDASVAGTTWVFVEKWEAAPAYVAAGRYYAPAIVLHFCPDGRFTMLKCMLYRQTHEYTNIGSDDGLQIYRGMWSHTGGGAAVTYHLADAEITFTGYEAARKRQIKASARLSATSLRMPVVQFLPQPARYIATTFQPKTSLPAPLCERFIDCDEHPQ